MTKENDDRPDATPESALKFLRRRLDERIAGEVESRITRAVVEADKLLEAAGEPGRKKARELMEQAVGIVLLRRHELRRERASLDVLAKAIEGLEARIEAAPDGGEQAPGQSCTPLVLPRDRGWEFVPTHESLVRRLERIAPKDLRCVRMMGTMIGAAGRAEAEVEDNDYGRKLWDKGEGPLGMIEETAQLIYKRWNRVQSLLLIGSSNSDVPMDQAPYYYYTYLFISRVVSRLVHLLQEDSRKLTLSKKNQQLKIQFTFVREDILFAQFFYDKSHLIVAATYSWNTLDELRERAYAAVYLDNLEPARKGEEGDDEGDDGGDKEAERASEKDRKDKRRRELGQPRFPDTARRLVEIFDARFRDQVKAIGQEEWTLKRLNERDWGVLVETPFWRLSKSVLRAFEFQFDSAVRGEGTMHEELGPNMVERFRTQVEDLIGLTPLATRSRVIGDEALQAAPAAPVPPAASAQDE